MKTSFLNSGRKWKLLILSFVLIALIVPGLKFFLDSPYRSSLPGKPDPKSVSPILFDQITSSYKKAYYNPSANNLGKLGMVYHSSGQYENAALCYKLAIRKNSQTWKWNYYLGCINIEMSESDQAIQNFKKVVQFNPKATLAYYYLGEVYQNIGKTDLSIAAYKTIINQDNDLQTNPSTRKDYFSLDTYARFHLARIYINEKQSDSAEIILNAITRENRSFGPAYRLLGDIYHMKGDSLQGKRFQVRSKDLAEWAPPVDTLLDKIALMSCSEMYILKKIDEAEKGVYSEWAMTLIKAALTRIPDNKYLISKAFKIYLVTGQGAQAVPFLDKHIQNFQNDFSEMRNVGDLLYKYGYYKEARKYYSQALKLRPEETEVATSYSITLWNLGEKVAAVQLLDELFNNHPKNISLKSNVVNILFSLGERDKALSFYEVLKQKNAQSPYVAKLRAMISEQSGDLNSTMQSYEAAMKGIPQDMFIVKHLTTLYIKQGKWDKAIQTYRKGLVYHPNDPYLLERLGTLLVSCPVAEFRNIQEGFDFSERAFINILSHSTILVSSGRSLAIAYASRGDSKNAAKIMGMTIQIARKENLPREQIAGLENIYNQLTSRN